MKSNIRYIFFIIVLLSLMAGMYACRDEQKDKPEALSGESAPVKTSRDSRIAELMASLSMYEFAEPVSAPDIELPSVKGRTVSLAEYRGKVLLVSFWATW